MRLLAPFLVPVVALAAGASLGCGTTYLPRPGPRISIIQHGGSQLLVKEGRAYPAGSFGSGLIDAVQGNPEAVAHAEKYRSLSIAGFVVNLVGAGTTGVGAAMVGIDSGNGVAPQTASFGVLFGGIAAMIVGAAITGSAYPHMWDAINVYNDSVEPAFSPGGGMRALPPGYGAPPPAWMTPPGYGPPPPYGAPPPAWQQPSQGYGAPPPAMPPSMPSSPPPPQAPAGAPPQVPPPQTPPPQVPPQPQGPAPESPAPVPR